MEAWERAKEILGREGVEVEEVELPGDFEKITRWHGNVLAGEGRTSFLGSKSPTLFCLLSFHSPQQSRSSKSSERPEGRGGQEKKGEKERI